MNILIFGANGLLGRNLVNILSLNHIVFAVVKKANCIKFNLNGNVQIIEENLSKLNIDILPYNIDVIYYLAQSNKFREFPDESEEILDINVVAPIKIVNWAVKNRVRNFIYASSGGIYQSQEEKIKESVQTNTNGKLGFYLSTKLSAEILLKNYSKMFETFIIIRPFFMYGIGQNQSMLIPRLIKNIKENKEILLSNDCGISINPIYITDVACLSVKMLELRGDYIINIAGSEVVSIKELCYIISKVLNKQPLFMFNEHKQDNLIGDISIMEKLLGRPQISLEQGIFNMVQDSHKEI